MKIGAIIQARYSSTRLPGKVTLELPFGSGVSVLGHVIRRTKKSKLIDEVIVATTTSPKDDLIVKIAKKEQAKCFRGSEKDVLERFYLAAKNNSLDYIIRITSDCPCIDPKLIDSTIKDYFNSKVDYISYCYPRGIDIEVIPFELLEEAHKMAKTDLDREHVSKYIYESKKFKVKWFEPHDKLFNQVRLTLDVSEDYLFLCALFDQLYKKNNYFGLKEIISLYKAKPWLFEINNAVFQKREFKSRSEEMTSAVKLLELNQMNEAAKVLKKER
jgi:spore coat polysaccharide biosynthesis protein SpsF